MPENPETPLPNPPSTAPSSGITPSGRRRVRRRRNRRRLRTALLASVVVLSVGLLASCSDDDEDAVEDAVDEAGERLESAVTEVEGAIDDASARVAAEAFAAAIDTDEDAAADGSTSMAVIEENIADLPGEPEVTGVEDADGDGVDDDGLIGFVVDEDESCVELSPDSGEASVLDGPCP